MANYKKRDGNVYQLNRSMYNDGYDDTTGNELNEIVLFDVDKSKILYKYS